MKVSDLMTSEVATLQRNEMLSLAEQLMNLGRIRHLPVVDDDGELVGIVSQRDLFHSGLLRALGHGKHAAARVRDMLPVKEVMSTEVVTTTRDSSLSVIADTTVPRRNSPRSTRVGVIGSSTGSRANG